MLFQPASNILVPFMQPLYRRGRGSSGLTEVTDDFGSYSAGVSLATLPGWVVPLGAFLTVTGGFVRSNANVTICIAAYEPSGFMTAANHQVEVQCGNGSATGSAQGAACAVQSDGRAYHVYADRATSYFGYLDASGAGSDYVSYSNGQSDISTIRHRLTVTGTGASRRCTAEISISGGAWTTPAGWGSVDFGVGKRLDGGKGGIVGYSDSTANTLSSVTIRN